MSGKKKTNDLQSVSTYILGSQVILLRNEVSKSLKALQPFNIADQTHSLIQRKLSTSGLKIVKITYVFPPVAFIQ